MSLLLPHYRMPARAGTFICAIRLLRPGCLLNGSPGWVNPNGRGKIQTMNRTYRNVLLLVPIVIVALLLAACDASIIEVRIEPPPPKVQPPAQASGRAGDGSSRGFFQLFAPGDDPTPTIVPTETPIATPTLPQETATAVPPPTLLATPSPIPPPATVWPSTPTPLPPPAGTPNAPQPTATWVPSPTPVGWSGPLSGAPPTLPPPNFPSPTAGPSPTITASDVLVFDVGPTKEVAPGDTFIVHYEVSGSGPVAICTYDQNTWVRQCATNLPLEGALEFTMPDSVFYLDVRLHHSGIRSDQTPVRRVNATCVHPWFFQYEGDACPNQPQNYYSVKAQQFEGGLMVDDLGRVTVYFDDGTYRVYWSDFSGGNSAGLTPPGGLLLPGEPFAGVWANDQNVYTTDLFDRLGWAVSAPYNFATTTQCEFSPLPFSPCFRLMPDSRVIRLDGGIVAGSGNTVTEGTWGSPLESN